MLVPASPVAWRLSWSVGLVCSLVSQMIWWASPAHSQSFLLDLLGIGQSPQVTRRAPPAPSRLLPSRPADLSPNTYRVVPSPSYEATARQAAPPGSGSFTTVCVRMCDGFYFPINFRTSRGSFHKDADTCRSRCPQSEARLFYHPSTGPGANMNNAVDLTGRSYEQLPIAFAHRKRLVAGCTCQPAPWSSAAAARHDGYAVAEGKLDPNQARRSGGGLSVVAGNYPATPARADGSAVTTASGETSDTHAPAAAASQSEAQLEQPVPHMAAPRVKPSAGPTRTAAARQPAPARRAMAAPAQASASRATRIAQPACFHSRSR